MCGILITANFEGPFHHRMLRTLRKRGPNEVGFWTDAAVSIGHTRLAIIGLDERSTEPLEDENCVLAFNSEIYNFIEIRERLESQGIALPGANSAGVLLRAWSQWGAQITTKLTGFWAFVVYDKRTRKFTLVRDQFGIKPLYYWREGTKICVSSMIGTILEVLKYSPELNYEALSEYLIYQFTMGDETFLRGIRKVLPGHLVEIDLALGRNAFHVRDIFAAQDEEQTASLRSGLKRPAEN